MSFQLAPKIFWWAELISQFFCKLNSSKYFTYPSGKLRTKFTSLIAKSTSPRLSDTTFSAHCVKNFRSTGCYIFRMFEVPPVKGIISKTFHGRTLIKLMICSFSRKVTGLALREKYYTWVYFGKLPWKMGKYVTVDLIRMQPKLAMVSWQYVVNKCIILFLCLHIMGNGSLKSSQMDPRAQGRKPPCLAHSVCAALHGIGLWDLQSWKKCSISLFSVLNRVTIIF